MRLRVKCRLAGLVVLTLTMPVWAHTYKQSLAFDQSTTIKGAQLNAGSYEFRADGTKKELNILQAGKIMTTVQGQWVDIPGKPRRSSIVSYDGEIIEVVFKGSRRAFQLALYTSTENNAYQAAHNEKDLANQIKQLDDFVMKYPMSALLRYVYRDYYLAYYKSRDYPKAIEYAEKELSFGEKVDIGNRLEAYIVWAQGYLAGRADQSLETPAMLAKTKNAVADGLKLLAEWEKPTRITDEQYAKQKIDTAMEFDTVTGMVDADLKDFKSAEAAYKTNLSRDPNDAVTHFHLGVAYLQDTPPLTNDGFWELARAIALKIRGGDQVHDYVRGQLLRYQRLGCPKLTEDEISQMVTLAGSTGGRASALSLPSADDLKNARNDSANFLAWLQEGGAHGQTMWLATCGSEYADIEVRVMEVAMGDDDNVTLKVFRAPTEGEMQAATVPNMEIRVVDQPEARRIQKDDYVRFAGRLTGYNLSPFLLTWDSAKVKTLLFSADNQATSR